MTIIISSRALVLYQILRGLDEEISDLQKRGIDTSKLQLERNKRAEEMKYYLDNAKQVKRSQSHQ